MDPQCAAEPAAADQHDHCRTGGSCGHSTAAGTEDGAGDPNPYDFVKLSFVYITQNAMAMAYKIMELAATRGFQTNVLIALQTWSIVERLQIQKRECDQYLDFLITAIPLAARQDNEEGKSVVEDSNLKI